VTGCVFEKGAKIVCTQPTLCLKYCITLTVEKSISKIWPTSLIYKKQPKVHNVNNHPIGENSPNLVTLAAFTSKYLS
jgi:hypothetical protein